MGAVRDARIAAEASRNREDLRKGIALGLEMKLETAARKVLMSEKWNGSIIGRGPALAARELVRESIRRKLEGDVVASVEPHTGPYIRPKTGYPSHVTRLADASDYGEVCVLCGFTDLDPHKLEATCYVGGGFCGTHNIVYNPDYNSDLDGVVKAKCTVCEAGTKMGLMGPCYEILPFKPMQVELIASDRHTLVGDSVKLILTDEVLEGEVYTPYGTLTGPLVATQYVADLVADDTAPHLTNEEVEEWFTKPLPRSGVLRELMTMKISIE